MDKDIVEPVRKANKFARDIKMKNKYIDNLRRKAAVPIPYRTWPTGANVDWIKTGVGSSHELPTDDKSVFISELIENDTPFYNIVLDIARGYMELSPLDKQVVNKIIENIKRD